MSLVGDVYYSQGDTQYCIDITLMHLSVSSVGYKFILKVSHKDQTMKDKQHKQTPAAQRINKD
jgi:hypothetical protein